MLEVSCPRTFASLMAAVVGRRLNFSLGQPDNTRKSTFLPCTCECFHGLSAVYGSHIGSFSCWKLNSSSSQLFPLLCSYLAPSTVWAGGGWKISFLGQHSKITHKVFPPFHEGRVPLPPAFCLLVLTVGSLTQSSCWEFGVLF